MFFQRPDGWPWLALVAALAVFPLATVAEDTYLRGYVDALLDSRYAGHGLTARQAGNDGSVTLVPRTCLGPWQKRDIEYLLLQTGRVSSVTWAVSAECDDAPVAAAPGVVPDTTDRNVAFQLLPDRELFAPLIADPRQPRFSMSYQRYRAPSQTFDAASVALGEYFGLAEGVLDSRGSSQIGIQAAVFALFNLNAPSSDLVNADYWIGLPLSYRRGPWSYQLKLYHQSSHLGDEFILGNPGVNRVNLSYEEIKGLMSYEWEHWRVYGGGGYILHSEPDLKRKHVQGGIEFIIPRAWRGLDFVAAMDAKVSEEIGWKSSFSYQAGFEFKGASQHRVRLMFEHFDGHSPNGQFYQERVRYTGLGLYFGF